MEAYIVPGVTDADIPPVIRRVIPIKHAEQYQDQGIPLKVMTYNVLTQS